MRRLLVLLTLAAASSIAVAAYGAGTGGSAEDPTGDSTGGPGTDIVRAGWSFDGDAGSYSVSVTFVATSTAEDWGAVNASLRPTCDGTQFALLRGSSRTATASASVGTAEDGVQPDGSVGPSNVAATATKSDDGRTTTMAVTHPRLVGRSAGCVVITISHHSVLDSLTVAAGSAPAGPSGTPTYVVPTPTPAPGSPSAVRLSSTRKLRFRRGGVRVALTGVSAGMTGTLRLWRAGGTTLARGSYKARSAAPLLVRLGLTRKGGSYLRRHRSTRATLTIRSTLGRATAARRYAVRARG